jgi:XTP/dITP diphosphohydrolase
LNDFSNIPEIKENGKTFTENAIKKARFYSKYFNQLTLADDSGLEVETLQGMPGIHSARYAGVRASPQENNQKLLSEMEGIPTSKRGARFKCVMALASTDGKEAVTEGVCRGRVGFKEVGKRGFGYDPLFILPYYGKTMAQLSIEDKNRISHRGKALRKMRKLLGHFAQ